MMTTEIARDGKQEKQKKPQTEFWTVMHIVKWAGEAGKTEEN